MMTVAIAILVAGLLLMRTMYRNREDRLRFALRDAEVWKAWWATECRIAQDKLCDAEREIVRLKRGDFTPEEFQAICHNRHEKPGCTRADFEAGCVAFQRKLFGATAPVAEETGFEPCCKCGDPYPRAELLAEGYVVCKGCRHDTPAL